MTTQTTRPRPDFVTIQLTAAGIAAAGGGANATLSIRRQTMDYTFVGNAQVEVLTSEWRSLAKFKDSNGNPIFQPYVAPVTTPAATTKAATAAAVEQG